MKKYIVEAQIPQLRKMKVAIEAESGSQAIEKSMMAIRANKIPADGFVMNESVQTSNLEGVLQQRWTAAPVETWPQDSPRETPQQIAFLITSLVLDGEQEEALRLASHHETTLIPFLQED